ncbi:hypothetical protein HIM_12159 [Hirsutella minnesotensis 3608]|uniref:DUF6314 domain-containing protein n=1 Tax=Hirsutella minnesotensis 3608 TaxID=1043627 RepID=A0A0F7ZIC4_9HYPO|nr:hypothetical protein HIM_12159 [Hirsutella minnesotensis 3608]
MPKSVCVVGAGPSGLAVAKTLLHNAPKGTFNVSVFDKQAAIGGLWPTSPADGQRQIHPLMLANQSRHTMHFSDLAWNDEAPHVPRAWQVGLYLERYHERFLAGNPAFILRLGTRIIGAEVLQDGWSIVLEANGKQETARFDYLVVASGHFGKPIIPPKIISEPRVVPVIHSSQYRNLKALLGEQPARKGRILVVGGQMSGIEIAGTIAAHLSSAINSPDKSDVAGIDHYSVHHVVQRPTWVFPTFTTPEPGAAAAPFLPLDFAAYNANNRPLPLVNTQGHISEGGSKLVNGIFEISLGTDQSVFSRQLQVDDKAKSEPAYLAISDWYCDFVRSGLIILSKGKLESLPGTTARLDSDGTDIHDVAAVVLATGFDPSPCLSFLPKEVLAKLHHSPQHPTQPIALAFHGTHHPEIPRLGFVGFYRSPYWGVIQMQARFLAEFWSHPIKPQESLSRKLAVDHSAEHTLELRDDPRLSQFPMGDYPWIMQEMAEGLEIESRHPSPQGRPLLSHNQQPLDMLIPSWYVSPSDDAAAHEEAAKSVQQMIQVANEGLTTPKFVAGAVFRSLLGTWKLERDLVSKLPSHPSGHFSGTAQFLLRDQTSDGLKCAGKESANSVSSDQEPSAGLEYLYIEDGEFKTDAGFGFRASRRYVWRYHEQRDILSVWFAKPDDPLRADYLFHEVEFEQPSNGQRGLGWRATAGHLCIDDFYNVEYNFAFKAVNLVDWIIGYTVNGPKKDYTISGRYTR